MTEGPSIPRRAPESQATGFDTLRAEGVRLLEQLSGEVWTDYNLHDPGITILEQLCFGLTDLIYRAEFDVADHLTGPEGSIEFVTGALHQPQEIFACRPTTVADLRRKLLGEVETVDDVWVLPWSEEGADSAAPGSCPGLYRLIVRIEPSPGRDDAGDARPALAHVLQVCLENRNLCEDVQAITVAEAVPFRLVADVDVAGARSDADILDEIHHVAEEHLAGRPRPRSARRALRQGATLDQLFTGPSASGGPTLFEGEGRERGELFLADLVTRVQEIEGVERVRDLYLLRESGGTGPDAGGRPAVDRIHGSLPRLERGPGGTAARWTVPRLADPGPRPARGDDPDAGERFEEALAEWNERVRLWRSGRRVEEPPDFPARFRSARRDRRGRRAGFDPASTVYRPPRGEHRALARYRSIQEHFPAIYGLNREGVPGSAPADVRTNVYRLKAYLLIFEQVMANFVANLAAVRDLFSTSGGESGGRGSLPATYRFATLEADDIPGYTKLRQAVAAGEARPAPADPTSRGPYLGDPDRHNARVVSHFDDVRERRHRLLDHMLAVFAESAPAELRAATAASSDDEHVRAKQRLLEEIVGAGRDRAGASAYAALERGEQQAGGYRIRRGSDTSGFERRVALLLGIDPTRFPRQATPDAPAADGSEEGPEWLRVVEHVLLRPVDGSMLPETRDDFYALRMSVFFPGWIGRCRSAAFRHLAEEVAGAECPAHLLVRCYWLGEDRMVELERCRTAWLDERASALEPQLDAWQSGSVPASPGLDAAAERLRALVRAIEKDHGA